MQRKPAMAKVMLTLLIILWNCYYLHPEDSRLFDAGKEASN